MPSGDGEANSCSQGSILETSLGKAITHTEIGVKEGLP